MLIWQSHRQVTCNCWFFFYKNQFSPGKSVTTASSSQLTLPGLWHILEAFFECSVTTMACRMHARLLSFSALFSKRLFLKSREMPARQSSTTVYVVHRNTRLRGRGNKSSAFVVLLQALPRALASKQERILTSSSTPLQITRLFSTSVISSAPTIAFQQQHLIREMIPT